MYGEKPSAQSGYSYAPSPVEATDNYDSDTELGRMLREIPANNALAVFDDLMTALQVVNPRMYAGAMRKLREKT